jgi:hypothetical protein
MRWNVSIERLADAHARRAMNVPVNEPTPPVSEVFGYRLIRRSNFP